MSGLVLIPKVSEKAMGLADQGVYVFEVPITANKLEVARAVAERFKVEVAGVNMQIHKGKAKTFRRVTGRQKDVKKALVRLKAGQSIALFEGTK